MLRMTTGTEFRNMLKFRNMLLCVDMFKSCSYTISLFSFVSLGYRTMYNLYSKHICSVGVDTIELLETTKKPRVFPRYQV